MDNQETLSKIQTNISILLTKMLQLEQKVDNIVNLLREEKTRKDL